MNAFDLTPSLPLRAYVLYGWSHTKISEVENKITNTSSLVTTTVLNIKISEVENKIPDHAKYVTVPEFNKLTAENYTARLPIDR